MALSFKDNFGHQALDAADVRDRRNFAQMTGASLNVFGDIDLDNNVVNVGSVDGVNVSELEPHGNEFHAEEFTTTEEDVTFNFQDNSTTDTIDSWFIVIEYESNVVTSDAGPSDHLIIFEDLSEERPLNDTDNLTVENIGADIN